MSEKIYVVTLKRREDLEDFYSEMNTNGFRLHLKRPLSRNTHYYMTEDQAVTLRQDDRVVDVQLTPEELGYKLIKYAANYPPSLNAQMDEASVLFWKHGSGNQNHTNWGLLQHCDVFSPADTGQTGVFAYTFTGDITAGSNVITNVSGTTPAATPQGYSVIEEGICKIEYNEVLSGNTLRTNHNTYIRKVDGNTIHLTRPILGTGNATGVTFELYRYDRQRDVFGLGANNETLDDIGFYSYGRHVDLVICDEGVSWDCGEWWSSQAGPEDYITPYISPGNIEPQGATDSTRFVDYQWFNALNGYVSSIDDDSQVLPTGQITRFDVATNPEHHGNHVAGTAAGRYYGWAKAANIYELQTVGTMQSGQTLPALLIFDYLRAFHKHKDINPITGFRNPTVSNHSYGYGLDLRETFPSGFALNNINAITYRGTTYNASNPGPSGWTLEGIETDFGVGASKTLIPADVPSLRADVEDAIEDGVVIIGAAGNDNFYSVPEIDPNTQGTHVDWNNTVVYNVGGSNLAPHYYNRGGSPANAKGAICVGALSAVEDFRRAEFTNHGPRIDVFAAGQNILSAWNGLNPGVVDSKYQNTPSVGDRFYTLNGTSMASPQVAGIAACLASGKERFTNADVMGFIDRHSDVLMRFDLGSSGISLPASSPTTYDVTVTAPSASYYTLSGTDRDGSVSGNNVTVTLIVGDTINFNLSNVASNHPFRIRDSSGGSDVSTPAATGQGSTGTATVSWTPNTAGTYVYQCQVHSGMIGNIVVQNANPGGIQAGSFGDYTCSQGSPNKSVRFGFDKWIGKPVAGTSGELAEGVSREIKGKRLDENVTNQTFPRRNTLFRSWDHA